MGTKLTIQIIDAVFTRDAVFTLMFRILYADVIFTFLLHLSLFTITWFKSRMGLGAFKLGNVIVVVLFLLLVVLYHAQLQIYLLLAKEDFHSEGPERR
ncbi:hypothetical protein ACJX0J_022610, partial [Zea mays]